MRVGLGGLGAGEGWFVGEKAGSKAQGPEVRCPLQTSAGVHSATCMLGVRGVLNLGHMEPSDKVGPGVPRITWVAREQAGHCWP